MAKNRKLLFLTIAVLFQIFFLYQAVFNYHVYTLDPAFRSFAEDFQSDAFSDGYTGALFIAELLFRQFSCHCRLYMTLADTEILSLYLLLPVLQPALFQKKKMAL